MNKGDVNGRFWREKSCNGGTVFRTIRARSGYCAVGMNIAWLPGMAAMAVSSMLFEIPVFTCK